MGVTVIDRDKDWRRFKEQMAGMKDSFVKVGFPSAGTVHPTAKATRQGKARDYLSLVEIASVHEFGSEKACIPARPFLRTAYDDNVVQLNKVKEDVLKRIYTAEISPRQGLEILGEFMVAKIKKKINEIWQPPLAKTTIDRKRSTKPLIDTGQMRNSVQFKVVSKKGEEGSAFT